TQRNQLIARISSNPETITQLSDTTLRDYLADSSANFDDALAFLFSPKDGMAPFTDITQVVTGKTPWQLFLYKYGMGQSALAVGVLLLAALIALRIFFGLIGWLVSPITGLFGQR
ncbi:MAG: hypothetical protein KDE19_06740, partial [Caldilineaceae bacterium]|nr:hypothetical protein [Caldilineaceae bacterium]